MSEPTGLDWSHRSCTFQIGEPGRSRIQSPNINTNEIKCCASLLWSLVGPHRIDGLLSSSRNAVITAIAFERTVSSVICPFQLRKIDIFTGNVLNGRIVGFAKCQRAAGIGDHMTSNGHDNASRIPADGNRMIPTRNLNLFFFHVLFSLWNSSDCEDDSAEGTALN